MLTSEAGGEIPPATKGPGPSGKRARKMKDNEENNGVSGGGEESLNFLPFFKPNYKRLYPENSTKYEFKVFVESSNNDRLGNKSPIYLNHIFTAEIKGVVAIHRVNASKIAVIFKQYNTANNFLTNNVFLDKYKLKAFIPAAQIEKTGIIRYVPTNISNKELYYKLSSTYEIIAVRRFFRKVNNEKVPLQTVSITFLANMLPDSVQYDLFSYRVFEYIPPLQQCYRCFKFNHSAKVCNGKQRCSVCSGEHYYKDCDKPNELSCINCSGPHLAISNLCPVKIKKNLEKKNKITYASTVAVTNEKINDAEFPALVYNKKNIVNKSNNDPVVPVQKTVNKVSSVKSVTQRSLSIDELKSQLINNAEITNAIVRTLISIANKGDDTPITSIAIKDLLLKNLS